MNREGASSMHALPATERPRERLLQSGAETLSAAELIAIILGSGTRGKSVLQLAQEVMMHFETLDRLSQATVAELCQLKGLGKAKALQLTAAFGLMRRLQRIQAPPKCRLQTPSQAYLLVKDELEEEKRELFLVLLQDVRRHFLRREIVAVGTLSHILVHPREVFYPAIRHKAASLVLVHNHPSGDPTPSAQDRHLTATLIEAGRLIGIPVADHLVIGKGRYFSFREEGMEFD